ncbi:MAG TPA: hypothetical protein DD734_02670, partial [Firmicutes bacterium]|nr:hypothetical protein [Bacillota bacterium]
ALTIAQMLDVEFCGAKYNPEAPSIYWQDGLPDDELEQATIAGQRVENGTMSQQSAIMRLDKADEEAARKELELIQEEKNTALPGFARIGEIGNFPANPFRQGDEGAGGGQ